MSLQLIPEMSRIAVVIGLAFVIYNSCAAIYNTYLHPLAKFPGPRFCASSNALYCWWFLRGRQPYKILALHKKYGPVVRIAPNELSFNSAQSWKDIYGFRPGHKTFIKSEFYDGGSFADQAHSIVSERDPTEHGKMRKYLSHAFSDRSLSEQEDLIADVIDTFITQVGRAGPKGLDASAAFGRLTFDIIGTLAFGATFGGVESGENHPWISIAVGAMTQGALADTFKRFPSLGSLVVTLFPGPLRRLIEDTKTNEAYAIKLIKRRINTKTDRKDFMTRMLENRDPKLVSDVQLAAHASDFVLAGSETTATALSCITYYLLHTPDVLKKLQHEIRTSFKSYDQINNASATALLPYTNAVALEGLRIYPPLPFSLPRLVPDGGDTVDEHFVPAGTTVSTSPVASSLSPSNFVKPEEFIPDRWLGGGVTGDVKEASQPFSLGPRGCLGRNLGWMELRTTLAKIHFTYDLKLLDKDLDWQRDSRMRTLWHRPALRVEFIARKV